MVQFEREVGGHGDDRQDDAHVRETVVNESSADEMQKCEHRKQVEAKIDCASGAFVDEIFGDHWPDADEENYVEHVEHKHQSVQGIDSFLRAMYCVLIIRIRIVENCVPVLQFVHIAGPDLEGAYGVHEQKSEYGCQNYLDKCRKLKEKRFLVETSSKLRRTINCEPVTNQRK